MQVFIDTLAEDIRFVRSARNALVAYPKGTERSEDKEAAFTRIIVMLVYTVIEERVFKRWEEQDFLATSYFGAAKNAPNGERIRSLIDAFSRKGVAIDEGIIEDYLAVKYLRNAFIHGGWDDKQDQVAHVESRGFPADPRLLGRKHWHKIRITVMTMMEYIHRALLENMLSSDQDDSSAVKLIDIGATTDLDVAFYPDKELSTLLIRKADLPAIYWHNMQKVSDWFLRNDEDQAGIALGQREQMHEIAVEAWEEYYRLKFENHGISANDVRQATRLIESLRQRDILPRIPIGWCLTEDPVDPERLGTALGLTTDTEGSEINAIIAALKTGERVYYAIPNMTPARLFAQQLPQCTRRMVSAYIDHARHALMACRLRSY